MGNEPESEEEPTEKGQSGKPWYKDPGLLKLVLRFLEGDTPGKNRALRYLSSIFGSIMVQLAAITALLWRAGNVDPFLKFVSTITFGVDFAFVLIGLLIGVFLIIPSVLGCIVGASVGDDRSYLAVFARSVLLTFSMWGIFALILGIP